MERPHLRSIGINEFIRWSTEGSLKLSPKFQRRRVWPKKARAYLIDTVLRGLPIPKIYMRQHLDLRGNKTIHEVVDGQQRLAAVLDFYADKLALAEDDDGNDFSGKTYSELPRQAQKDFLTYEFSVDLLVDAADADVLDVFARINSYAVPLNAQEKRNARFFGSFKSAVYRLGFQHLEFWKKHKIVSDTSIARMKEAELTSELLVAMAAGLQDKKSSLEDYYEKWDDRFPYKKKSMVRFTDVIDLIDNHLGEYLEESNFHRAPLFYSLFLAIYELRYESLEDFGGTRRAFGDKEGRKLKEALEQLDEVLESDIPPDRYLPFVTACQQQTDNVQPRRVRRSHILRAFAEAD